MEREESTPSGTNVKGVTGRRSVGDGQVSQHLPVTENEDYDISPADDKKNGREEHVDVHEPPPSVWTGRDRVVVRCSEWNKVINPNEWVVCIPSSFTYIGELPLKAIVGLARKRTHKFRKNAGAFR